MDIRMHTLNIQPTYGSTTDEFQTVDLKPACNCNATCELFGHGNPMGEMRISGLHKELVQQLIVPNDDPNQPPKFKDCIVTITPIEPTPKEEHQHG